jgi:hypothetical protein
MDKRFELLEEFQTNNFFGDIVGELMKQLRSFEEKKAKERDKLVQEGSDELLQKFDDALETTLAPKRELISKLKHVYDFYHVWKTGDAINTRRHINQFLESIDRDIMVNGKFPNELMSQQIQMLDEGLMALRAINLESKEFTKLTGIEI